jgi:hypothetical protein
MQPVALAPEPSVPLLLLAAVATAYWYLVAAAEPLGVGLGHGADGLDDPE